MNDLFLIWIIAYVAMVIVHVVLDALNLKHMKHAVIPSNLQDVIDQKTHANIKEYTYVKSRFGLVHYIFNKTLFLTLLLTGVFAWWYQIVSLGVAWGDVYEGLVFFLGIMLVADIIEIPFSLYSTFKIEQQFGFNTQTRTGWIADFIKGLLVKFVLLGLIGWVLLTVLYALGGNWWWVAWLTIFIFGLILSELYPVLIAPLFNTFTPLKNKDLLHDIQSLFKKADIKADKVFKMDASKRSKHSNAYFTGLGKNKRVVLFDTLMQTLSPKEIVSVLAHEIGHWKKKHVVKSLVFSQFFLILFFYIASKLIWMEELYDIAHVSINYGSTGAFILNDPLSYLTPEYFPLYFGLFMIFIIWEPVSYFMSPFFASISRKHEYEADAYSVELCNDKEHMKSALINIHKDNLANLHPHKYYEWFYYSHPSLVRRMKAIDDLPQP